MLVDPPADVPDKLSMTSSNVHTSGGVITLVILLLFNILAYCDRMIMTLMIGPIRADLGISDVEAGLLIGLSFALFFAVCAIPMGIIVDRVSRRKIILAGMLGWSALTAVCGMAGTFTQLFLARLGVGLGEASLMPAAQSLIAEKFPRAKLTLAMSVFMMGAIVGAGLAMALGGTLVANAVKHGDMILPIIGRVRPWQTVFLWLGLAGVILAPLVLLIREPQRPKAVNGDGLGMKDTVRLIGGNPRFFAVFLLTQGLVGTLVNGAASWLPEYSFRHLGFTPQSLGLPYGLMMATTGIVSHFISGGIIDRMVRRGVASPHVKFQIWTLSVGVPLAALGLFMGNLPGFYLAAIAFFMAVANYTAYAAAAVQSVTPARLRGKMAAIFILIVALFGQGLGPIITPLTNTLLFGGTSLNQAMGVMMLALLAMILPLLAIAYRPFGRLLNELPPDHG